MNCLRFILLLIIFGGVSGAAGTTGAADVTGAPGTTGAAGATGAADAAGAAEVTGAADAAGAANLVPVDTTEAPTDTTSAPSDTTEAPSDTTEAPSDTTDVPADTAGVEEPERGMPPGREQGRPPDPEELRSQQSQAPEMEEYEPVVPLTMAIPSAYRKVLTDSLTRWQLWSDQGEWVSRQPGVISFQLGGLGRNDGYLIRAHEPRHQRIYRDGILLNERIFGSANRKRLPHYSRMSSVHEFTAPVRYRTDITTLRYHVSRPLTLVNFEQSAFEYRSTEGYLTRNITPSTNFSLAYWGKNEDEGYQNRDMGGRNAEVTAYHYFNDSWMLEGGYHYSGLQLGEPDGYFTGDMHTFSFDRFEAPAIESQGRSSMRNSLFRLTAYNRDGEDSEATSRVTAYHDRYRRLHYSTVDSSFVRTLTTGLSGRHIRRFGPFELKGDFYSEWSVINRDDYETMEIDSWVYSQGKGMATLPLPNRSQLHVWLQAGWRSDDFTDYELGSKMTWRLFGGFTAYASYARGEQMPQPGQLYWKRLPVYGLSSLQNEVLQRAEAGLRHRSGAWDWGGEVHASNFDRPILVGEDSTFVQAGSYRSVGATGWMAYDGERFEFSLSGTYHQYFSDDNRPVNQLLNLSGQRAWTRVSLYYKNYVFNRAAFMKTGFYIQASPTWYRTSQYYPAMDYWDSNSFNPDPDFVEAQAIPEFVRLDLDLTARVRSGFFFLRLENALDSWLMPGYFETAYQPMPPQRLRFGIRWYLRN